MRVVFLHSWESENNGADFKLEGSFLCVIEPPPMAPMAWIMNRVSERLKSVLEFFRDGSGNKISCCIRINQCSKSKQVPYLNRNQKSYLERLTEGD